MERVAGAADEFAVTLLPAPPECTRTVTGRVAGPLTVSTGVTCLDDATVAGPVVVRPGAGLVATGSTVLGPVTALRASAVELLNSTVRGPVSVTGTTAEVTLVGGTVCGPVALSGNRTGERAPVVAGVRVFGPLLCTGNAPAPDDLGAANEVNGPATGQCTGF